MPSTIKSNISTKQTGDIAEYFVIAELLSRGCNVLVPCGDRLPYDIAIERSGRLIKIQVKHAWWNAPNKRYIVDVRRSLTNRKEYKVKKYTPQCFDFLVAYIRPERICYIIPSSVACSFAGAISFVEGVGRQRLPRSAVYRDAWNLLED